MTLAVQLWTEEQFAAGRETWQELLGRSDADPLFMSWDWQWTWWQHHHAMLYASLQLLAVVDAEGRLVGLAPLYRRETRVKGLLSVQRLECLGTAWGDNEAAFSEYFDIIAARGWVREVATAVCGWLAAHSDWDDWAISHVRRNALVPKLASLLGESGMRVHEEKALPSHVVDLGEGFEVWVERLSSDVRRRLHHHRGRLRQSEFRLVAPAEVVTRLDRLQRWRTQRYSGAPRHLLCSFEQALAGRLTASGALRLSELTHLGQVLSVMFDVRVGDTEYYLASAFAPDAERGLSPGYLHFGYAIEAAAGEGAKRFDLLAGHGRHRDYKADLAGEPQPLRSLRLVRAPLLKFLYGLRGAG